MTSIVVCKCRQVALLIFTAGLAAQAASIVSDGGFESPAVECSSGSDYTGSLGDGWSATSGSIQICNAGASNGVPHSGVQMAYLDTNNTTNEVEQTLTTVVGQAYLISYWVADTAQNFLGATFGDQLLFVGTAPANGVSLASDYVNETLTLTADSTSTILSFTGRWTSGNGTILDDVSVTAIPSPSAPEPATLGFTALGCIALFAKRGRRALHI